MKKRTDWRTPLDIPEGKIGNFAIRHQHLLAGTPTMLSSMRNLYFGQKAPAMRVKFDEDTRWHILEEGRNRLMSDWPVEQLQHDEMLKGMRGRVLVGGLGIGYAAHVLATHPRKIKEVVVVEISEEVIELVGHTTPARTKIVPMDLFDFLKEYKGPPFDHAFYDIWSSDGEGTFHDTVVPLLQLSQGKVLNRPKCWNEQIMRGQIRQDLQTRLLFVQNPEFTAQHGMEQPRELWEYDGTDQPWWNWRVPFFRWWKDSQPSNDEAAAAASVYATLYGQPIWKEAWELFAKRWKCLAGYRKMIGS